MSKSASDLYGTTGSVLDAPQFTPEGRSNPNRANAQEFGGQIGAATEKLGGASEQIATELGGMVSETLMTDADTKFATQVGKIKGDYTSLTGMAAYNAFPKYQQDIAEAFQSSRENLPYNAQRGFDRLAARTMANHIADGSSYASSQLKEANRDSYSDVANTSMMALLDPDVAKDPERSQYHIDTLKYAAGAQLDHEAPGMKTDPDTGEVSFDLDTDHGKAAKADHEALTDKYLSQGYVNKYDTLAKQDPFSAYKFYKEDRDNIPKAGQIALDASFAPRLMKAHSDIATGSTLNDAAQDHWDALTNPSKSAIDWTMQHEGGFVSNDSGRGPSNFGINKEANPDVDVANLTKDQAAGIMKERYWDKIGADKMSPQMGAVAMDTAVNMGVDKAKKLIDESGGDPQKLIDLRRAEYQRLATANPEKYGQYLEGWNKRMDDLQEATEGKKTYATNDRGGPLTQADYYRQNSEKILEKGDAYAESQMPGDLALKRAVRSSLSNYMAKTIANENAVHIQDNKDVMKAINGDLTKGKPPETEADLRAIPGMSGLLDKVATQDPKFSETIPTLIAKVAQRDKVSNSPNGYNVITGALENSDGYSRDETINHLAKGLGTTNPGIAISYKDFNDAKAGVDVDPTIKTALLKNMQTIAKANGNADGQGEQRAVKWYSEKIEQWKQNTTQGDKALSPGEFKKQYIDEVGGSHTPGVIEQLENKIKSMFTSKPNEVPTFASPEDPGFSKLPSGSQFKDASGKIWTKK